TIEGFATATAADAGNNPTKNNYQIYLENAITKWTTSNEGVSNPDLNGTFPNSSFNDLVKQNMCGYEILNDSTSFSNIKVSFTQLSSQDANSLGDFANDYWLTITATANNQINFTAWNGNLNGGSGGWGTNIVKSVPEGTIFTWTLPYALSTLTNYGNSLSLTLNTNYGNASSNESLYDPFGLSIGKTSNLTSISSQWQYNYHGVICTNFGTNGEDYVLPSKWTVAYSQSSNTLNRNQLIANVLDSFLDQTINVSSYDGMDEMSAVDALNNQTSDNLIGAITSAIQNEIQKSKETFNIDSIAYTISEIVSGIQIKLPTDISLSDNETGEITGVALSYNNISLTPKNDSSNSFTVTGFLPTSSTQTGYNPGGKGNSTNRNHQIATQLDSLLNQIINVGSYESMSSISAADALNNQATDNLTTAIISAIEAEIGTKSFNIDGITYTAKEIASGISIGLPKTVTLQDDETAQIPGVTLSYNGISLTWKNTGSSSSSTTSSSSSNSDFIVNGFMKVNSKQEGSNTNANHQIASKLDSLLNQVINVGKYESMSSYTAADA
ncbi:MAG: hypothetical protein IIT97_00790, partial [Mycoplasmataceae bacterium]|nr:hypothetical protein [Mycoplasmataceae bacterium]